MTKALERPRKIVSSVIVITFLLETTVVAEIRMLQSVLPARFPSRALRPSWFFQRTRFLLQRSRHPRLALALSAAVRRRRSVQLQRRHHRPQSQWEKLSG